MTEQELREIFVHNAERYLGTAEGSAEHKEIIDLYNSYMPHPRGYEMTMNDSWCAAFVSAITILSEMTDIMPIECSCYYYKCNAQDMGIAIGTPSAPLIYSAQIGDIIIYDWDNGGSHQDHIGIIALRQGKMLTVIEGNKNNIVDYRYVDIDSTLINCIIFPNYAQLVDDTDHWDYGNLGWNKDDKGWWYAYGHNKGEYHKNNTYRIANELFFFDTEGYCVMPTNIECDVRGAMKYIHGERVK